MNATYSITASLPVDGSDHRLFGAFTLTTNGRRSRRTAVGKRSRPLRIAPGCGRVGRDMGVYIYVVIVVTLLVLPSLVFVLVNRERGVPRRRSRASGQSATAVPGVTLPPDARPPVSVFFEGVELEPERDYDLQGQQILLHTALQPYTPSVWREF